jgi:YLP motif-containing protein 1
LQKSNPLPEEEIPAPTPNAVESKRQSIFQERLRAEHDSFKAVFDRRRQRIGGLVLEEE